MTASAKIVADSINPWGDRLTTLEVVMHRFVLAEFNTHRVFSRNSASSRAIPVTKQLRKVREDPAWPVLWACEKPGMQGGAELTGEELEDAERLFHDAHASTVQLIEQYLDDHPLAENRLHKSLINRLMEPFMWHTVIVSSTEWDNFFYQRSTEFSPLAQPEMRAAADAMYEAFQNAGEPRLLNYGQWHTPYVSDEELFPVLVDYKKISVARCARVSYLTHDGIRDYSADIDLFDKLVSAKPRHESPLEHVATPASDFNTLPPGNFTGWHQLRHWEGI